MPHERCTESQGNMFESLQIAMTIRIEPYRGTVRPRLTKAPRNPGLASSVMATAFSNSWAMLEPEQTAGTAQ